MAAAVTAGVCSSSSSHARAARRTRDGNERRHEEDKDEKEATTVTDSLGKRQPSDQYEGDVNLRTLRTLLRMIDDRGWERYAQPYASPNHELLCH